MMLASQFALSAFNAPSMGVAPALGAQRAEALTMFGGGKKAAPKKAGAKPAGRKLVKSAANSKAAVSATGRSSTFIDVTGRPYVEVDTFIPKYDEIGVLPPLGRWDPLQIREQGPERYRRFVEMEIKHGRMSMLACAHVFVVGAGFKFPGYISYLSFPPLKFEDIPASPIASWETLPQAGWAQIVCLIAIIDNSLVRDQPSNSVAAGGSA